MDALTHAIEVYVGLGANPFTDGLALEAISLIAKLLGCKSADIDDFEAGILGVEKIERLMGESGLHVDIQKYGITREDAERVCKKTLGMFLLHNNPRNVTMHDCMEFYLGVMDGENIG
jgi:alcohol dehydrogenase class IV